MLELEHPLSQMRAAWLAATSAINCCPPSWREALGEGPETEAALAALAAHATQTLFRPCAPPLSLRPLLPMLSAPQLPPPARGYFRRLLAAKADEGRARYLIWLVSARGYAVHPADWMPSPRDEWAPDAYAPWLAWAAAEGAPTRAEPDSANALTVETYDDWSWAERRAQLAALRRTDPAAARKIISAKVQSESTERRLKLLEILHQGLAIDDMPIIEALASDRSDRVKTEARRLLARFGCGAGAAEKAAASELAGMVELTKLGIIKRRRQLTLRPLKTQAQEVRRRELLALVALADLATALGAPEAALVESAPTGEPTSVKSFVERVAATGSDAAACKLLDEILAEPEAPISQAIPLAARASPQACAAALVKLMLREEAPHFPVSLAFAGERLGAVAAATLTGSKGYAAFTELLQAAVGDDQTARVRAEPPLKLALANLGLLLAPAAAATLIEVCVTAGLSSADPRLDPLHLNAALTSSPALNP